MRSTARIAAITTLFVTVAGFTWLVLESTPVRLGFEDTDDPTLMVDFIRQYPAVFAQAGVVLIMMAIGLTIAVLAVADVIGPAAGALSIRATRAFGLFSAGLLLLGGGIRVGSSGPLLHMAGLSQATGEAAYVAAQVVSQAVLNAAVLALCLWAVGLSVIGLRSRVLPLSLCALGVLPGYRIVGGLLGPVGLLPDIDVLWLMGIASIFGTFLWCLLLGLVLFRRGFWAAPPPIGAERCRSPAVGRTRQA